MLDMFSKVKPASVRLEASTVCQLRCVSCPTADGQVPAGIGAGFLRYSDFKKFLDSYPWVRSIELSNYGEIFLNPEIVDIIRYAYGKNVELHADNGVNLNTMTEELLEALVKYQFRSMTCSIDGASDETYRIYRRRGNFDQVIHHIKKINEYKEKYGSPYPRLLWQFIAFGHNEHEIPAARKMANDLQMGFHVKLSFGDLYNGTAFSPVKDRELIRRETGLGVADRQEYHSKNGVSYNRGMCMQLWKDPQINYDGRVLGCCINFWGDYGNAFKDGLVECLNCEKINYARAMLMGNKPPRSDIPCTGCYLYDIIKSDGRWFSDAEVGAERPTILINKIARRLFSR